MFKNIKGSVPFLILILGIIIIFNKFLFGNLYFFFADAARDSINLYYPLAVSLSEQISDYVIPSWSFKMGLGQYFREISDPFLILISLFSKENIPQAFVYVVSLRILVTGFLFYNYLKLIKITTEIAILGAILYAFSGYMILGSNWFSLSTSAFFLAAILYSYEVFLLKNKIIPLTISLSLFWIGMPLNIYFAALFLLVYSTFRYLLSHTSFQLNKIISLYLKLLVIGILAIGISSVFLLPASYQIYMSPRISGGVSYSEDLISTIRFFENIKGILTIVGRFFSSDLLGSGWHFSGKWNYLEAPMVYIGILPLILFPNIFLVLTKKNKIIVALIFLGVFMSLFVPFFRNAIWLFQGEYFRVYGLMLSIILLILGIFVLHKILLTNKKISNKVLIITTLIYILFLVTPNFIGLNIFALKLQLFIILYCLLFFTILFFIFKNVQQKKLLIYILIALSFSEVTILSYRTINNRDLITKSDFEKGNGYNDYSSEVIAAINKADSSFFRISKNYLSSPSPTPRTAHNDALVQNYYGISSYNSFNHVNYVKFLQMVDVISLYDELQTRFIPTFLDRPQLHRFLNVKYHLIKNRNLFFEKNGFNLHKTYQNISVYKNKHHIPLGITYDKYILHENFEKLSIQEKDKALFSAFVIDSTQTIHNKFREFDTKKLSKSIDTILGNLDIDTLKISYFSEQKIIANINIEKEKLLLLTIPFDKGWNATVDNKNHKIVKVDNGLSAIILPKGKHTIILNYFPAFMKIGIFISLFSIILLVILVRKKVLNRIRF